MIQKRVICFLGPQGSGKGTQAELLSKEIKLPNVSTGSLYRSHIEQETAIGLEVRDYIEQGNLVPDVVTNQLIKETLGESIYASGIILDGFPRTIAQKDFLDNAVGAYDVVYINLSEKEVIKRVSGRLQCLDGHIYHLKFNPPQKEGECDIDQLPLTRRKDDTEEYLLQRLNAFNENIQPLLDAYKDSGKLHIINGEQSIEKVSEDIKKVIL